ncbi:copper-binding protein [Leeia sp. TBRC 13508]|uniref:Copper-binding protein n=1 Tax=Leeia speluncae TaxID=2884804 RepID=A0ABS8DAT0_9NEIS|nr:copper-binding protein [Leeia speluncae]MCB6184713.1 copper-binding protein [Leeia speluncae]
MKLLNTLICSLITCLGVSPVLVHAEEKPMMPMHTAHSVEGEIKKVDLAQGKVTIKHGPIAHMDMPGMTMVFTVKDKAELEKIKQGDKVTFEASHEEGKMLAANIQVKP